MAIFGPFFGIFEEICGKFKFFCGPVRVAGSAFRMYVATLLQAGADPLLSDDDGGLPIHYAAMHNHSEVVKILIEQGGCRPDVSYSALQKLITYT